MFNRAGIGKILESLLDNEGLTEENRTMLASLRDDVYEKTDLLSTRMSTWDDSCEESFDYVDDTSTPTDEYKEKYETLKEEYKKAFIAGGVIEPPKVIEEPSIEEDDTALEDITFEDLFEKEGE